MSRRDRVIDVALAIGLLALSQLEAWGGDFEDRAGLAFVGAALTLPLLARRRWPLPVLVWIAVTLAVGSSVWPEGSDAVFPGPPLIVAVYSAGRYCGPRAAVAAAFLTGLAIAAGVNAEGYEGIPNLLGNLLFMLIVLGVPFAAGRLVRARSERVAEVEAGSEERAKEAAAAERARIARELHDVVGHALGVIAVQAGVERKLAPAGPQQEALGTIERTAREALGEMRRLVGMLRVDADDDIPLAPQPRVAEIGSLVEQLRRAGRSVELVVEGEPRDLPPGVDLSGYRIIQEALTNAVKHAGDVPVRVTVHYAEAELTVAIEDEGPGPNGSAGGGFGLVGMRERVAVLGGDLDAGAAAHGGYAVRVRLPI